MKKIKAIIIVEMIIISIFCLSMNKTIIKYKPITLSMNGTSEVKEKPKPVVKKKVEQPKQTTQNNGGGSYKLTHYGPDCSGCGGQTAAGYDVSNTIYYNDSQYGQLRVVAMSSSMPLYSVIKIHNYYGSDITAIVLDRGVGSSVIDLLVESESKSSQLGIQYVNIDVLRYGR